MIGGGLSIFQWRRWHFTPKLLLIGVSGIFGYHFLLFMALRFAPPVSANLLNYLWPLLILLFTPAFFPQFTMTKRHVVGAIISFLGAASIVFEGDLNLSLEYSLGYLLAILAAITWSIYTLLSKKVATFSSATVGLFCLISGMLALIVHTTIEVSTEITQQDLIFLVLLGIGPMGIAFYCWDSAIKKGDPRIIASLSYFTPLLSTILLVYVNNQPLTLALFYAMVLIVSGAVFANFPVSILSKVIKIRRK